MTDARFGRLYSLGLLLLLLVVAEIGSRAGLIPPFILPAPSSVIAVVPDLFVDEGLGGACLLTLGTIFTATFLASVIGVPLGALLATHDEYGRAYTPWLEAAFSAPVILLYPMFLIFFGRTLLTVVVMGLVVAIIPVVLKTREGVAQIGIVLKRVAQSLQMTRSQAFWKLTLPAATPSIFVGIRLALIYAMINIVAVEFLVGIGGLGNLISDLYDRYDVPLMYGAVAFVILLSVILFIVLERLERWLKPA